jgi:hypothetical protein
MIRRRQHRAAAALALGIMVASGLSISSALPPPSGRRSPEQAPRRDVLGAVPLGLEANGGQTDPEVRYLSRGEGYGLFLTAREIVLVLGDATPEEMAVGARRLLEAAPPPRRRRKS